MGNEMSSQANIVRMLKLLGVSEKSVFSDVKRFPSVDDRRKAKFRTDLNATAFHPIQRVFRAMTAGILKMLLPAWHVPDRFNVRQDVPGTILRLHTFAT